MPTHHSDCYHGNTESGYWGRRAECCYSAVVTLRHPVGSEKQPNNMITGRCRLWKKWFPCSFRLTDWRRICESQSVTKLIRLWRYVIIKTTQCRQLRHLIVELLLYISSSQNWTRTSSAFTELQSSTRLRPFLGSMLVLMRRCSSLSASTQNYMRFYFHHNKLRL